MNTVVLPIACQNSTPKEQLVNQRIKLIDTLHVAHNALENAAPKHRDFYRNGPEYFEAAKEKYRQRIKTLTSLITEIKHELMFL